MKRITNLLLLFVILVVGAACKSTLQEGGAYNPAPETVQPEKALYAADASYKFAWVTINTAFDFERENRATLWKISPDIKKSLDKLRPEAQRANTRYLQARAVYLTNSVSVNLSDLESALSGIQRVATSVQAVIPTTQPTQ